MSTSTFETLLNANISTAWGYLSSFIEVGLPYAIGLAVVVGSIYFVLRRLNVLR